MSEQTRFYESLLHEYDSLRSEILATQSHRFQIVAFTLGIIGVIMAFGGTTLTTLMTTDTSQSDIPLSIDTTDFLHLFAVGLSLTLYAVIIPSILMARAAQRSVATIGSYLRDQLEPKAPGLNWETNLNNLKISLNIRSGLRGMGGIYFFLSFIPLLFPLYVALSTGGPWFLLFALALFSLWPLWLSWDLHTQCSRTWRITRWDDSHPDESQLTRIKGYINCSRGKSKTPLLNEELALPQREETTREREERAPD